ncbi:hypothetical protein BXZ70DRAFT_907587 [Cristinia sonorae]|uniref:Uncharacterized protein n=1 Tax=Cristinia sonorae TaxID=1940300 RepID=A0A8K0UNL8_9AGAR|nr:hypothetical protein BXZ70DRAFT_907587 [Cristinia sonorae]
MMGLRVGNRSSDGAPLGIFRSESSSSGLYSPTTGTVLESTRPSRRVNTWFTLARRSSRAKPSKTSCGDITHQTSSPTEPSGPTTTPQRVPRAVDITHTPGKSRVQAANSSHTPKVSSPLRQLPVTLEYVAKREAALQELRASIKSWAFLRIYRPRNLLKCFALIVTRMFNRKCRIAVLDKYPQRIDVTVTALSTFHPGGGGFQSPRFTSNDEATNTKTFYFNFRQEIQAQLMQRRVIVVEDRFQPKALPVPATKSQAVPIVNKRRAAHYGSQASQPVLPLTANATQRMYENFPKRTARGSNPGSHRDLKYDVLTLDTVKSLSSVNRARKY